MSYMIDKLPYDLQFVLISFLPPKYVEVLEPLINKKEYNYYFSQKVEHVMKYHLDRVIECFDTTIKNDDIINGIRIRGETNELISTNMVTDAIRIIKRLPVYVGEDSTLFEILRREWKFNDKTDIKRVYYYLQKYQSYEMTDEDIRYINSILELKSTKELSDLANDLRPFIGGGIIGLLNNDQLRDIEMILIRRRFLSQQYQVVVYN